jgi:hypothetical protein
MAAKILPLLKAEYVSGQNSYTSGPLADRKPFKSESPEYKYTIKWSHSEFLCGIIWYYLLLRHYHFLFDTSNLLQTTEHTVR